MQSNGNVYEAKRPGEWGSKARKRDAQRLRSGNRVASIIMDLEDDE